VSLHQSLNSKEAADKATAPALTGRFLTESSLYLYELRFCINVNGLELLQR
jgi:hypothetical protein